MREPTICMHFVEAVLHYVETPKERRRLLLRNRIAPALIEQASARVAAEDYASLIHDTMRFMEDEALGYATAPQRLGCWDTVCHFAIGAETLGEALERFSRFYRLFDWGLSPRMKTDGAFATFSLEPSAAGRAIRPYLYESFLFYVHRFANWLIAEQIPLKCVDFHFARPAHAPEYRAMFLLSPMAFERPVTKLVFADSYLERPLKQTQRTLKDFLRHPNHAMIVQQYDQRSWHYRVRTLLSRELERNPSFFDIAAHFHVHPQTLRRHLQREGFQYQEIKARVRRDAAIYLLSNRKKTVEEAASLTGFSEASSFIRSFRSWTGVTPYTYRKGG